MSKRWMFSILVIIAFSCDDVLETDIRDDTVVLKAPKDGYSAGSQSIVFWWESLKGATRYHLVVVSPELANPTTLIMDTVIVKTQFSLTLTEGQYQWCVKGMNDGYETDFTCRSIEITN